MNNKSIDTHHDLDDFDEEEKVVDPLVLTGFTVAFFSVVGVLGFYVFRTLAW